MVKHSNVPIARQLLTLFDEFFFLPIILEKSRINSESLGIGSGVGIALSVGLLDVDGEAVTVGESLGLNDGVEDGCVEGDCDAEG